MIKYLLTWKFISFRRRVNSSPYNRDEEFCIDEEQQEARSQQKSEEPDQKKQDKKRTPP
jgi:hypothetical protein